MISQEYKQEIGERWRILVNLIIQRGYAKDQTEVGKLVGIQSQAMSSMMRGERIMTIEHINSLAKITNFNTAWLLMGQEPIFLEKQEDETDIIDLVVTAMNNGQIPQDKAERIIKEFNSLRQQVTDQHLKIEELNNEIIGLLRVIQKA